MAFSPTILRGNKFINDVDVSDQVMAFRIIGTRDTVEIPATFGTRRSVSGGDDTYQLEIGYLSDTDAEALTQIFWTAIADDDGTIEIAGTVHNGPVSATNPLWRGVAQVTEVGIGGTVNAVGQETHTFPLLDRPVQDTATPPDPES